MLSLFKRYRMSRTQSQPAYPFTFMTLCEQIKPMSQVEFEFAQQSLEFASDWLYQRQSTPCYSDAGHIVVKDKNATRFQDTLSHQLALSSVPVVLANCHEMLLNALPVMAFENDEIGIVSIGHHFELKQTLDLQVGSAFHFALSRYNNTRLFCIGIDEMHQSNQVWEYAEDLGCDWLTLNECGFRHRNQLKSQLGHYIEHCDQLIVTIDLASLVPGVGVDENNALDNQMVLRTLRQCALSGKVKLIQLVGAKDKLIYSKQTKEILDELCALSPDVIHAA
ncbi:arginase family protein [Vibrio sp. V03_P4A6T147]|uniref:arginase family protein n=1 Tax=Vibrio sp. V03_P4A6T147 TaxID=1938658 RepID=UPI000B8EB5AE|nr:arginase [Vibrio sp. V03_P4A6T147]